MLYQVMRDAQALKDDPIKLQEYAMAALSEADRNTFNLQMGQFNQEATIRAFQEVGLSPLRGPEAPRYPMSKQVMRDANALAATENPHLLAISQLSEADRNTFELEMKQYNQVCDANAFAETLIGSGFNRPPEELYRNAIKKYLRPEDPPDSALNRILRDAEAMIAENPKMSQKRIYRQTIRKFLILDD
jgi:hypothetical protein